MRVEKHGKIVDIPVRAGTIVKMRESRSGRVTDRKAVVVGTMPPSDFSRAYGRQVFICEVYRGDAHVHTAGAGDLYPIGKAKRVPKVCKQALAEYEGTYLKMARRRWPR